MAVTNSFTVYPLAEMIEVETNGTTSVDIMEIPQYTLIEKVFVRIKTAGTGTANLTVGDDDDADGFILAADATASAGTVYGDATSELGTYLTETITDSGSATHSQPVPAGKLYTASGKEIKVVLSASLTTEAVLEVFIIGKRFMV